MRRCWQPAPDLVWATFDDSDEWIVYNGASGNVHLLTANARQLWMLASSGTSVSIEDLTASVATAGRLTADPDLAEIVRASLDFMDEAGLLLPLAE